MLGIGFVCLLAGGLMFGIGFVCYFWELGLALGLSVSWLGDLCLALGLSVFCGNDVGHWVCLFFDWVTYVR